MIMSTQRYGVSVSAGKGYQVWDKQERKITARRSTFKSAQKEAQRLNRLQKERDDV